VNTEDGLRPVFFRSSTKKLFSILDNHIRKALAPDYFSRYIWDKDIALEKVDENGKTLITETDFRDLGVSFEGSDFAQISKESADYEMQECSRKGIRIRSKEEKSTSFASMTIFFNTWPDNDGSYCTTGGYLLLKGSSHYDYYHIPEENWRNILDTLNAYSKTEA